MLTKYNTIRLSTKQKTILLEKSKNETKLGRQIEKPKKKERFFSIHEAVFLNIKYNLYGFSLNR